MVTKVSFIVGMPSFSAFHIEFASTSVGGVRSKARNKEQHEIAVEFNVHDAHFAFGIIDLVDTLFLFSCSLRRRCSRVL